MVIPRGTTLKLFRKVHAITSCPQCDYVVDLQIVAMGETLALFMELQTYGDRNLKKLAYSHVIRFIQRINKKHKDEAKNKPLQNVLFQMLQVCTHSNLSVNNLYYFFCFIIQWECKFFECEFTFIYFQREEESIAKRSLVTLCDLHRRKVWSDERTVNSICMACFHPSSRWILLFGFIQS